MRESRWLVLVALLAATCLQCVQCSKRVLAVVESDKLKQSHSSFFEALGKQGFDIDIKQYKDNSLKLRDFDDWLYDHLVIFAPRATSKCALVAVRMVLPTALHDP